MDEAGSAAYRASAPPRPDAGTPPPADRYGHRRLTRPLDRKLVAGVCAGLGDYFDVDPVLFRVGFVVLTLFGGVGLLAYAAAWWIIPASDHASSASLPARERVLRGLKRSPNWLGVLLLIIGAALLIGQIGVWRPPFVWGIALIGIGVLLFRQSAHGGTVVDDGAATDARAWREADGVTPASVGPAPNVAPTTWDRRIPRAARHSRTRSGLGWLAFGAALLAVGIAAVLDSAGVAHPSLARYFALPLAILGAGLLVGSVAGRARWLIVPGVLLIPLVLAASLITVPLTGGYADRVDRPATVAQVRGAYHLIAGQQILDLRQVAANGRLLRITMTVGAGSLVVLVPRSAEVSVRGRVGGGEIQMFGRVFDGVRADVRRSWQPASPSGERIVLDLSAGLGQVKVSNDPNDVAGIDQGGF